ncbi:MAG TPA: MBOAT family protein [Gemmatimonadales bacterium]|nr:MBOAT family protein [Gemmatimonadales bacterium]
MLFNSFVFLLAFLPITYIVFWQLESRVARYAWLTAVSYVFYGYWDAKFCLLMLFSTVVAYTAGLGFLKWPESSRARRLCLIIPITVDLSLLGFFKYADFALQSVSAGLRAFGAEVGFPRLDIILPVGISFYTFHTISYIVDCYRGVVRPTRNLLEFSTYVSLFAQLVAGPIVRFRQVEQDLENLGKADRTRWLGVGVAYFVVGMFEKVVVADYLASFVDPALSRYWELSTTGAWLAMLGYTFQLYFDFSGYSDMAVGLGYMFGIRLPINFNSPYKALNPSDFWRRWHISLSGCLRDYVYIPLGGNRGSEAQTYRNLLLTMLIGGLWHGANWTFVVWGLYHGMLLALYRAFGGAWDRLPRVLQLIGTFVLVVVGWVMFRSTDFTMAADLLVRMFVPTSGESIDRGAALLPMLVFAGIWAMAGPNMHELKDRGCLLRHRLALAAASGACVATMLGAAGSPFLYFQF